MAVSAARFEWSRPTDANAPGMRFFNGELSWFGFNRRVLGLAMDPTIPLLARVELCAIASSNLDEFFAAHVATLRRRAASDGSRSSFDGLTPTEALAAARAQVLAMQRDQDHLWLDHLRVALTAAGIRVCAVEECMPHERHLLAQVFERTVEPLLTPIAVGPTARWPLPLSLALSIATIVDGKGAETRRLVCVNVPSELPRFLAVGSSGLHVALEDAIVHFLPRITGGRLEEHATFRVTRDADDLVEAVEHPLRRRLFGTVVRLETGHGASPRIMETVLRELGVTPDQLFESRAPIGLASVRELASLDRPDLRGSWMRVVPGSRSRRDFEGLPRSRETRTA
jgi:polyphosphate kinase